MIELNMPINEIRYFDCGSWEFPQMQKHIDKVEKFIKIPINRMKYKYTLDYLFSEKKTKNGYIGYGFPTMVYRWCTGKKRDTLNKGIKNNIFYIGYTIDELSRLNNLSMLKRTNKKFPLIDWGWSEKDCLDYCYSQGFNWDGLYNYFKRVSCWCCPFQSLNGLRNLRKYFPELWKRLLEMQKLRISQKYDNYKTSDMSISFRMDGTTAFDLDKRFELEEKQEELF